MVIWTYKGAEDHTDSNGMDDFEEAHIVGEAEFSEYKNVKYIHKDIGGNPNKYA